jgi:hypothetical protein
MLIISIAVWEFAVKIVINGKILQRSLIFYKKLPDFLILLVYNISNSESIEKFEMVTLDLGNGVLARHPLKVLDSL